MIWKSTVIYLGSYCIHLHSYILPKSTRGALVMLLEVGGLCAKLVELEGSTWVLVHLLTAHACSCSCSFS